MSAQMKRCFNFRQKALLVVMLSLGLSACVAGGPAQVGKSDLAVGTPEPASLTRQGEVRSATINDLQTRQSILPQSGPYNDVASAVLQAGAGVADAELRMARLRAQARAKNWLPKIGPNVSLTSLGALAASMIAEQTIFDNGRRRAERAHAAADVELAAVTLVIDANNRVYDGLSSYVQAQGAQEQAMLAERALEKMTAFEDLMAQRVAGGISDRSEQQIIAQAVAEMRATLAADRQSEANAKASLAAMTTRDLSGVTGLQALPPEAPSPEPLAILQARAEATRTVAEAEMATADLKPGLRASASLDGGGVGAGIGVNGGNFGFGSRAERQALSGAPDLAARRVSETTEATQRRLTKIRSDYDTVVSREVQARAVLIEMAENLRLYTEQYKVGRRTLVDLVRQYEVFVGAERDHAALKYLAADLRLQLARDRGVLVDGGLM